MPAISVIMPVYNRQDRVGRAIESVLGQEFVDFELVIVDDASTDDTVRVIETYTDPRIRLLRQPQNRLGGAARNRGVREARCDLICFIDSDDEYLPHKLGYVVAYFAQHPEVEVLIDSFELVFPDSHRRRPVIRRNPVLHDSPAVIEGVYARHISKATPAITARRGALERAGMFDETLRRRQDFDLVVRLTATCHCATTDQVLWRKYWTEGAITSHLHTFMPAVLEMCRRNPEYLTTPAYRVGVARDLTHHVLRLIGRGEFRLIQHDIGRFAESHGGGRTTCLLAQGLAENIKRFVTGRR